MAFVNRSTKSGFILRAGGKKRLSSWISIAVSNDTIATASTAVLIATANAALKALMPFTIVRTRGILSVRSDQQSASETFHAILGMSVVQAQATAIGVTAVPTPATDDGSDSFYVYEEVTGRIDFTTGVGFRLMDRVRWYDSKAMRKVVQDQDVAVVLETSASSSGASILHHGRFLIKLF